jgi:hypothetical protein
MNVIHHLCLYYFILSSVQQLNGDFTPNTADYDAYGTKIAMNQYFLVLAQNNLQPPTFFVQLAPYDNIQTSSQCSINYPNTTNHFVYTVALGKKQSQSQIQFFFAGELTNDQSGIFVGIATYNNMNATSNAFNTTSSLCSASFSYSVQYIYNYDHQEYYIIEVDPKGVLAYGFTNEFLFVFDSQNPSTLDVWSGNLTWSDSSFIPHAVDISDTFGVIAGFVRNAPNATVVYSPMIYLINFNSSNHHPIVVNQYQPIPTPSTWQALLTNSDAGVYSAKYDMSVSIDQGGNVLVGMQFINRAFLFSVNTTNPILLNYVSRYTNGRSLGNGKSIAWLDNGIAAILINVYSLDYQWSLSQIFLFDIYQSGYVSNSTPLSVFPNSHQVLPSSFSFVFLNIVSSPSSLALLDNQGQIIIFSPTQPGFYPFIQDNGISPYITSPTICMPGSYKDRIGVYDCILCPMGTKNPGNANTACIPCSSGSFCPLAAVDDVSSSALTTEFQVIPYPLSPESTIFDEILLHNMFNIGPGRCAVVSPLFWALMVAGLVIIIIIVMEILKLCSKGPRNKTVRKRIQYIFKHTDLIGEGELWVGGLVSFCVIVLVSFAFAFSDKYYKQYPIETSSDSNFACDTSIRNAKFDTNLQTLAIPVLPEEQDMFDLLNGETFTVQVDLINTLIHCDAISLQAQFGTMWSTIRYINCTNPSSILTIFVELPYQHISIQVFVADTKTIGGLRIGLSGPGYGNGSYTLKELNFYQSFSQNGAILAQNLSVIFAITKVVNETKPLVGEESVFSGIYIPTFTVDINSLFVTNDQYVRSALALTTLTFTTTETPYYVKNVQEPIARQLEIVFRNLLFTIVCLEIFGLVFLFYKLVFKPIYRCITRKYRGHKDKKHSNGDLKRPYFVNKFDHIDNEYISSVL